MVHRLALLNEFDFQPSQEPVDSSFCPQSGKPIQTKACSLRCKKDCVLTNWSQWLNCDCNSGPNGIQGIGIISYLFSGTLI